MPTNALTRPNPCLKHRGFFFFLNFVINYVEMSHKIQGVD